VLAGLAVVFALRTWRPRAAVVAALVVGAAGVAVLLGPGRDALDRVGDARLSPTSEDRADEWRAAWRQASGHLGLGVGAGRLELRWVEATGEAKRAEYTHNEYLEVLAELGIAGGAVLAAGAGALAAALARRRPPSDDPCTRRVWAGVIAALAAFAVHSAFDFLWHVPVLPVAAAVLAGLGLARPRTTVETSHSVS
jgi:O-antigen ligase